MTRKVRKEQLWSTFFGIVLIAGALGLAIHWKRTRPRAARRPEREMAVTVRVIIAHPENARLPIEAFGEVLPARQVDLFTEVSGRIVARHPRLEPGGLLTAGETALAIDPRDYEAAVVQAEANLEKARLDLALERSRARVAAEEWRRVGAETPYTDPENRALTLREPQVAAAERAVAAAEAALRRARWNLERTEIRVPFEALVLERYADLGQTALPQNRLATLVAADEFYVRLSLPTSTLRHLPAPDADGRGGALARILHELDDGSAIERFGRVVRILGDLDPAGRMARVMVSVPHPLDPPESALRLRAYVHVRIEGPELEGVYRLPIAALREGGFVWVVNGDNRLEIRAVETPWQDAEQVWVTKGLADGDRVIVSRLATPIPNLQLRIEGEPVTKMTKPGNGVESP